MPFWHRAAIAGGLFVAVTILARIVDWRLGRRPLPPEAATRYRVLRRSVTAAILVVGFCSALLVIPQVRAVAGGLLASSAVLGVIIGFASQRTLGNFVAGLLIAIAQPVRLGDRVEVDGAQGIVEEIGLTYTFIRAQDDARIVIPNEKLASDTIRNSTIRSREKVAEITAQVPLSTDLDRIVGSLRALLDGERDPAVFVSSLDGNATVTMRARAADEDAAQQLERELRLRVHAVLRAEGVYGS
jgi:small-conductance mechanosensitive channel